ncbi:MULTISPECIES: hypothetical protein [unclassified Ensifer]|uniref:hypothetical protein n=1 Tax=unclassified Ensifer TaxID=2633371 RepID=UPI0030100FAF
MIALVPALLSFALGAAWQSWRASSSEVAAQINDLLKDLKQLEDLATDYWTQDACDETKILEVKMRGLTFAIAGYETLGHLLFRRDLDAYNHRVDTLLIACTGGTFETSDRKADFARAVEVRECAAAVAALARKARQDSAGMSAIVWTVYRWGKSCLKTTRGLLNVIVDGLLWPVDWIRKITLPLF